MAACGTVESSCVLAEVVPSLIFDDGVVHLVVVYESSGNILWGNVVPSFLATVPELRRLEYSASERYSLLLGYSLGKSWEYPGVVNVGEWRIGWLFLEQPSTSLKLLLDLSSEFGIVVRSGTIKLVTHNDPFVVFGFKLLR